MLTKPQSLSDLSPPFSRIGDPDWDSALTTLLCLFDVPLANPSTPEEIAACEHRLGVKIPTPVRAFLQRVGPQAFDYLTVFRPGEIRTPDEWFVANMNTEDKLVVSRTLRIADGGGSDNVFAIHIDTGTIHFVSHDPLSVRQTHCCFDDLVREYCVCLYNSYYGWDDPAVHDMVDVVCRKLFPRTR